MVENHTRFLQSQHCPFLSGPLFDDVGLLGDSSAAEDILNGTYSNNHIPTVTQQYITHLQRPAHVNTDETLRTFDINDHIRGWNKAKERTAAKPHGLSFAHYKAAVKHKEIAAFDYIMREVPFRAGFVPQEWKNITDLQIYKNNRERDVESMRTITLFSSDFNINNKLLGQRIMKQAEANNILAPEQFGSRKNHRSNMVALNHRITFDLCRQRRQALAIVSVDAKSCYDRIIHNVACLSLRRIGIPIEPLLCMFKTLQTAHHYVMTAFEIS